MSEREDSTSPEGRSPEGTEQEAAKSDQEETEQGPPQDGTDNTLLDTEEHSDAPGPFGTG